MSSLSTQSSHAEALMIKVQARILGHRTISMMSESDISLGVEVKLSFKNVSVSGNKIPRFILATCGPMHVPCAKAPRNHESDDKA